MKVDPRLNSIDDCLYRVAIRTLIVQDGKLLVIREASDEWWALPGGGVEHGETIESTLVREIEEELGVPASEVFSDFLIAHYTIGKIVNGIPRMNLFFKASIPRSSVKKTTHASEWKWCTRSEFLELNLHTSYDKTELLSIIFGD